MVGERAPQVHFKDEVMLTVRGGSGSIRSLSIARSFQRASFRNVGRTSIAPSTTGSRMPLPFSSARHRHGQEEGRFGDREAEGEALHGDRRPRRRAEDSEAVVRGKRPVYMAPVSWFGKRNQKQNARFLHALTVDLDCVSPSNLKNLLKQIENGRDPNLPKVVSLPQPTFMVNSGTGMHLYYVLDKPVPLVPRMLPFLSELKRRLTDVVWTDFTSELEEEGRQYQGIYQGFRSAGDGHQAHRLRRCRQAGEQVRGRRLRLHRAAATSSSGAR
mgnify:CR=1 FL=1